MEKVIKLQKALLIIVSIGLTPIALSYGLLLELSSGTFALLLVRKS